MYSECNKCQLPTRNKKHRANVLYLNDITFNKRLSSLIGRYFVMPYVSYCHPLDNLRYPFYTRFNTTNLKTLVSLSIFFLIIACPENRLHKVDFLTGTWKIVGKEQYEVWEIAKNKQLSGYSYKLVENEKVITETLSIKTTGNNLIYEATVPDQNEGKTIQFTLNKEIKAYLSFENLEHDFPKKIQYKRINDNEIEVTVSGGEGEGFSYRQIKQKTK